MLLLSDQGMYNLPAGNKNTKAVAAVGVFVQLVIVSNKQQMSVFPLLNLSFQSSFLRIATLKCHRAEDE